MLNQVVSKTLTRPVLRRDQAKDQQHQRVNDAFPHPPLGVVLSGDLVEDLDDVLPHGEEGITHGARVTRGQVIAVALLEIGCTMPLGQARAPIPSQRKEANECHCRRGPFPSAPR